MCGQGNPEGVCGEKACVSKDSDAEIASSRANEMQVARINFFSRRRASVVSFEYGEQSVLSPCISASAPRWTDRYDPILISCLISTGLSRRWNGVAANIRQARCTLRRGYCRAIKLEKASRCPWGEEENNCLNIDPEIVGES